MNINEVKSTVEVSTNVRCVCVVCGPAGGVFGGEEGVKDGINHYLNHGYHLIHVGTVTTSDPDGNPWHSTHAVLGK